MLQVGTLAELYIYPIKSAGGIKVKTLALEPLGLAWDRRWMLVDPQGKFLTQRQEPRMALIRVALAADCLMVSAPGMRDLVIPLELQGTPVPVQIWKDKCTAEHLDQTFSDWFSRFLGQPCRLVKVPRLPDRGVDPRYGHPGDKVGFADGFPLLAIGTASMVKLNGQLARRVGVNRFRPNLVIITRQPFAEDEWQRIRIGSTELERVKPCSRCAITTIDPASGEKDPQQEPLRTLQRLRPSEDGKIYFGQNLIPRRLGTLKVGMTVELLR